MMEQTPVQRQLDLELECRRIAVQRLKDRTSTAEERHYASATVYGKTLIKGTLGKVSDSIKENISRIAQGKSAEYGAAVALVRNMDPDMLALITIKGVLDHSQLDLWKKTYSALSTSIGSYVYDQALIDKFEEHHPDLYKDKDKYLNSKRKGYVNRIKTYRKAIREAECPMPEWPQGTRHQVGAWLVNQLLSVTGWFVVERRPTRKNKSVNLVRYSDAFLEARMGLLEQAEALAWMQWPMLCEPVPWSVDRNGGYLTAAVRERFPIIRGFRRRRGTLTPDFGGSAALRMLNRLQRTAYKVNRLVYEVARECQEAGISIGKFSQEQPIDPLQSRTGRQPPRKRKSPTGEQGLESRTTTTP